MALTYFVDEHVLLKPDGTVLKRLSCPLQKRWEDLALKPGQNDVRTCRSCHTDVISLAGKDEATIVALLSADEETCVHLDYSHPAVKVFGDVTEAWESDRRHVFGCTYRVIKTARTIEEMNAGLSQNLRPLVKKIEANPDLRRTCTVIQNRESGEVKWRTSLWDECDETQWDVVATDVQMTEPPKSQIAAYLVPHDLRTWERVVLEDVIEEIVGSRYRGRGGAFATRLKSAEAIWDGADFVLDERYRIPAEIIG